MQSKICLSCKEEKTLDNFRFHKNRGVHISTCNVCKRKYDNEWYKNNVDKVRKNKLVKDRLRNNICKVSDYLKEHPCVDCGEKDILVLEFDHQKNNKVNSVSYLINYGYSLEKIFDEIKKCVVRCANCHRRKTAIESGWYKLQILG